MILACDEILAFFSTTALLALYARKAVIIMDFNGEDGARMFVESQATRVARSLDDLRSHFSVLISERQVEFMATEAGSRGRFLERMAYCTDGGPTSRVVDLVIGLLSREEAACV